MLPLGVFVVVHILQNARALSGQVAFERTSAFMDGLPLAGIVELVLVLLPLLFHAGYGVVLMFDKKALAASPYPRSWRVLVRGAAWVSLVFIGYHFYALALPRLLGRVGASSVYTLLTAHLSSTTGGASGVAMPWVAIFYLVGIAATTLHFAAGAWAYLVRTKRIGTPDQRRRAAYASGAGGVALFTVASLTVISLASGSPLFAAQAEAAPCPAPAAPPLVPPPPAASTPALAPAPSK